MGSSQRLVVSGVGPDEQALNKLLTISAMLMKRRRAVEKLDELRVERWMAMTP